MGLLKKITVPFDSSFTDCQTRLEIITTIDYLPIGVRYKGKQVSAYWCTNTEGNYVR
jgi:hypothetical protein